MRLVILSEKFYADHADCPEIMKKQSRPYYCVLIREHGHTFAIPLRHHANHPFAFKTVGDCGLDFSKAVLVDDSDYISDKQAWIDTAEWNIIRRSEDEIFYKFRKYLRQYLRAKAHPGNPRSEHILRYAALQYFDF